jgi:ferritin-like protein
MLTRRAEHVGVPVTAGARQRPSLLPMLIEAYWAEIETVMNYLAASTNLDGFRGRQIAELLGEEAIAELQHARLLADRVKQLQGSVPSSRGFSLRQPHLTSAVEAADIRTVATGVIDVETAAINLYREIASAADGVDWVTHELAVRLLRDEEAHRALFQSLASDLSPQ